MVRNLLHTADRFGQRQVNHWVTSPVLVLSALPAYFSIDIGSTSFMHEKVNGITTQTQNTQRKSRWQLLLPPKASKVTHIHLGLCPEC